MNQGRPHIRTSRALGVILILMTPLIGPSSLDCIVIVVASVSAYEGLSHSSTYGILALLFGIELIYGFDVGILTLSYLGALLLLSLVGRLISLQPWTTYDGWHVSDALRTFIIASCINVVMTVSGVIIGHVVYGYTDVRAHLQSMFLFHRVLWIPFAIVLVLVILRRIDEPFHRRITFGM